MMTIHFIGCRMAATDVQACETLLGSAPPGSPFAALLRRKLRAALPVDDEAVDPRVVTVNSRVEYRLGDEPPQKRILVRSDFRYGLVGLTLPITALPGLALLGLREGQSFAFEDDGAERTVRVLRVHYQPQAARRRHRPGAPATPAGTGVIDLGQFRDMRMASGRDARSADRRNGR